jgi:thiosulfate/3-mercaptopyruvate sulfurtransferase
VTGAPMPVQDTIDVDELSGRVGAVTVLDVRSAGEYDGTRGYGCDPRQGHIPRARHLDVQELVGCESAEAVRELVGLPEGTELVAYCHSGQRSAVAVHILRDAGYEARNYEGSWHDWSRRDDLPLET